MDDLVGRLNKLSKNVDNIMEEVLDDTAKLILMESKRIVPVDTGDLKRSLDIQKQNKLAVNVGTNLHYAGYVEFGTYKMRAQPYLFPAYEISKDNIQNELEKKVKL